MQKPTGRRAAFTLIEILLAMAIMAVICGTIYQFTGTTVRVADVATRVDAREQALGGLRRLLAAQFAVLPASEPQALTGATEEGKHGRSDALSVLCPAGSAVLTPDARGLYQATMGLREMPAGSGRYVLVMEREPWATDAEKLNGSAGAFQLPAVSAGGFRTSGANGEAGSRPAGWVRLLDGVRSLAFDYFDPRLNTWVDKWNDPTMSPSLVRVRLAMENAGAPYEFVEKVPGGGVPRLPANLASFTVPNFPQGVLGPPGASQASNGTYLPPGGSQGPNGSRLPNGVSQGSSGFNPPTAPPPGPPPTLPAGLRPPSAAPSLFDPTKPFMAPETGSDLPPGVRQ